MGRIGDKMKSLERTVKEFKGGLHKLGLRHGGLDELVGWLAKMEIKKEFRKGIRRISIW